MALHKIKDADPDYRDYFGDHDILSYDVYSQDEKVGSVEDLLVDENGRFRYFVINTGFWVFGKKVLLPIGITSIDYDDRRVYANNLTRSQVEDLPKYDENAVVDHDYEERTRNVYRSGAGYSGAAMGTGVAGAGMASSMPSSASMSSRASMPSASLEDTQPLENSAQLENATPVEGGMSTTVNRSVTSMNDYSDRTSSMSAATPPIYDRDPDLFSVNEQNHQTLRLYEERLIANKTRQKTGEVTVGKRVETETARVAVPIDKERVVIERTTPVGGTSAVNVGADAFREGEVARVEVYEETPEIRKEAFVREEVSVRKEVEHQTVESQETLRKEQLELETEGHPVVDNSGDVVRGDRV